MASTAPATKDSDEWSSLTDTDDGLASYTSQDTGPNLNVCFIGAGYAGGPTAAVMAYQNPSIQVTVVDKDEARIRRWNSKHLPIYEPGLSDIVRIARDGSRPFTVDKVDVPERSPNLFFSVSSEESIRKADIVFITVNTPTKLHGQGAGYATDMTVLDAAVKEVALYARPSTIVVEKSTVPCGTAKRIRSMASQTLSMTDHRPDCRFHILSNPEFLSAGTAVKDLIYPDRVLIGCASTTTGHLAANVLASVYAGWVPLDRIMRMDVWSAELSKLVANSMLAQRISSINSISAIYEKTDAEIDAVSGAVGRDARIGSRFLKAGLGFGGDCFKKDILSLIYLAKSLGLEEVGEYWHQVIKMNEYQRDRFARRVLECLSDTLVRKKATLLGYAFKANTSDMRGSPTAHLMDALLDKEAAEIAIFEACCGHIDIIKELEVLFPRLVRMKEENRCCVRVYSNVYEACAGSSAIFITTEYNWLRNSDVPYPGYDAEMYTDPRPFASAKATETEIFALHNFLIQSGPKSTYDRGAADPLQRFQEEPACPEGCAECERVRRLAHSTPGLSSDIGGSEGSVDWPRIVNAMAEPRWLFDGRGIIDLKEMAEFKVRVESIGHRSNSGYWD